MNKKDFLTGLRGRLSGLPQDDMEERIAFYSEMIDDRVEDGATEEEAVADIGTADDIVAQIMSEIPLTKLVKEKVKPKRSMSAWEIILLVLGSPIWLSLLLTVLAVMLAVYVVLWAAVVCLYAVFVSLAAGAVAGIPSAIMHLLSANPAGAVFMIGMALACAGLSALMFLFCGQVTKGVLKLTGKVTLGIKSLFIGKKEPDFVSLQSKRGTKSGIRQF